MVAVDGSEFWIAACGVGLEPATMIGLRPILSGSEPNRMKKGVLRTSEGDQDVGRRTVHCEEGLQ